MRRAAIVIDVTVEGRPISVAGIHMSHLLYGLAPPLRRAAAAAAHRGPARRRAGRGHELVGTAGPVVHARLAARRDRPSWPTWRPHSQIDHILVRGAVRPLAGVVFPHSGSDHRPIRAELAIG